jgi:hypothetical protein
MNTWQKWALVLGVLAGVASVSKNARDALYWFFHADRQHEKVDAVEYNTAAAIEELKSANQQLTTQSKGVQVWATDTEIKYINACDHAELPERLCAGIYERGGLDNTYGSKAEEDH